MAENAAQVGDRGEIRGHRAYVARLDAEVGVIAAAGNYRAAHSAIAAGGEIEA